MKTYILKFGSPNAKNVLPNTEKYKKTENIKFKIKNISWNLGPQYKKCIAQYQKKEKVKKHAYKTNIYPEIWNPQNKGRIAQYRKIPKNIKFKIKNISWKLDPQYKNIYCPKQKNKKHEKITNI